MTLLQEKIEAAERICSSVTTGGASLTMADILTRMTKFYDYVMSHRDSRVDDWFLMSSPFPTAAICIAYVLFVNYPGPRFMKDRKPYNIRSTMLFYNFSTVLMSTYCFLEFNLSGWLAGYTLGCQPVDYSYSPQAIRIGEVFTTESVREDAMVNVCYVFFISKFIELLDTVFFILRKKFNQVSFLHVFHHAIVPISWWVGVRFVPGGFVTFHAMLNSFIHVVMYTYYGLAALGPQYQKYLWWKKYMTTMQIIQFIVVSLHTTNLLFSKDCDVPTVILLWILLPGVTFLVLFTNFYIQAYRKKQEPDTSTGVKSNGSYQNGLIQNGTKLKEN